MKYEDVKVGMKLKIVKYLESFAGDWENKWTEDMYKFVGNTHVVQGIGVGGVRFEEVGYGFPWEGCEPAVELTSILHRAKINVQKYAEENSLSLQKAHEEIQPTLFAQGYNWKYGKSCTILATDAPYLILDSYAAKEITHTDDEAYFQHQPRQEVVWERTVTLTPSLVEKPPKARETIILNGVEYYKDELELALANIKPLSGVIIKE